MTLTLFALCRIPVVLAAFGAALWYYRRNGVVCTALPKLLLPLLGMLVTSAGDLAGTWVRGCFVFGASHLFWFAFLVGRGRFSRRSAVVLASGLAILLAAVVFPKVDPACILPFAWYAFCTVISVSAAIGARRAPGGAFYIAGLATLMISDICIGLSLADVGRASAMIAPLYVASLAILLVALVRGIPAPPASGRTQET